MGETRLDVTGVDLVALPKAAYELSVPQGLGFLHAREGDLSDDDATEVVTRSPDSRIALNIDYLHGRAVKLIVFKDGDRLTMRDDWFDHSPSQLDELLTRVGLTRKVVEAR